MSVLGDMKGGNFMEKESREEIAGTLMAISVVSKSLAKKIMEGEKDDEQDETSTKCSERLKEPCR